MRRFFVAALAISATALATSDTASLKAQPRSGTDDQAITHLLNRTGWGPRPGDVDTVRAMGIARYLDQQLHPERIPDAAMPGRLAGLATVGLSSRQILDNYERPQIEARRQRKADAQAGEPGSADQKPPDPGQRKANSIVVDLSEQKLLRAVYSERQLQEVLADFWFNHFNVDARKGRDRFMLTEYERDTIRPRVLGNFRDLLGATAKSPAMLFYLDNWMSADPNGPHADPSMPVFGRGAFGRGGLGRGAGGKKPGPNRPRGRIRVMSACGPFGSALIQLSR